jgi:hypothetical protein
MANKFGMAQDPTISSCAICNERVEHADKLVVESETIHKTCFKCSLCDEKLQMGHCAMDRALYGRYGPRWYCSLFCSTRPISEKEAKLKQMGVQVRHAKKKENENDSKNNDEITSFVFHRPSDSELKEKCKNLKIEYNPAAGKIWEAIVFQTITLTSNNLKTHDFKSPNVYACFSLFFTGKIEKCHSILDTVSTAFRAELINTGTLSQAEIDKLFVNTTATDEHLNFISKFLSCRIGIFENGKLKKFGNWKGQEKNALTILLSFSDGQYSIVLDL